MRPVLLKVSAFGPFPGTETIKFSELGDNPLFLINGPTGSGKTTILDAICFALYGKTTGDERDGAQMRCDLAPAEVLCEVSFDFELNGRKYRIRRVPEQLRPKSRGDGFTEQKPEAQLVELLDDDEELLHVASKVTEATHEIENLTGLSVDQFRQVMILPQGKFRQLLLAESADREKIFSKLFQTHIYKQLENRLKEQAAQVRRERENLQQQQLGILETVEVESAAEIETEVKKLQPQVDVALTNKRKTEDRFIELNNLLQQGQRLQQQFEQFDRVEADLQKLKDQQEQIEQQRQQLSHALAAEKISLVFIEQKRCGSEVEKTAEQQLELQQQLSTGKERLQETQQQLQQIKNIDLQQDQFKVELQQLGNQRQKISRLGQLRQLHNKLQQRVFVFILVGQLREKEQQLQQLKNLESLTRELSSLSKQLLIDEQAGLKLLQLQQQQTRTGRDLELAWHRGQAAILATDLKVDQPCPVCGSLDHPVPAQSAADLLEQRDLEDIREQLQRTTTKLEVARDRYRQTAGEQKQLQSRYEELQQQIDGALSRSSIEIEVYELQQQLGKSGAVAEISDFATADLNEQRGAEQQQLTSMETEIKLLEQELPEEYRQVDTFNRREGELQQQLANMEKQSATLLANHKQANDQFERVSATLQEVDRQLRNLRQQQHTADMAANQALENSLFADYAQYLQSLLDEQQRQKLQTGIEDFNSRWQKLNGAHEQLQQSLSEKSRPDLEQLQDELKQAAEEKFQHESECKILDSRMQVLRETQKKLVHNIQQLKELDDRYAVVGTLSDVANGQTGQKISLQRFVLSVLLDEVLLQASHRFSLMSKGRYQLLRNEDRSKGNKASGLDLLVDDAYTGKMRPVATLSGGESFMAALSLALGLSDVVQAHAGGIHLDTLFIDEGFGSLDSESLDLAIRTLVDLQSSGRMIGVISHVAELKEQIPLRIDVLSGRLGSSIKLSL